MGDYLMKNTSRKNFFQINPQFESENITFWIEQYLDIVIKEVRSKEVEQKIRLHLYRFQGFFLELYGHERISACIKRDIVGWQTHLVNSNLAPATINNHLASLSGFTSWVRSLVPELLSNDDPCRGVSELGLPPLEPRALTDRQVRSLKNICDRLPKLYQLKGRHWQGGEIPVHRLRRPWRDRAMIFFLLSTGLRREELVNLNLEQLSPNEPKELRKARKAKIEKVKGKGKTERHVFLSSDAREALADYLEKERGFDSEEGSTRLFLSARGIPEWKPDGRMTPRSINFIMERIGQLHDREFPDRPISPFQTHELRHTFGYRLAESTNKDPYELERRLGHRSQRYIQRYTNPPEEIAARYVEEF